MERYALIALIVRIDITLSFPQHNVSFKSSFAEHILLSDRQSKRRPKAVEKQDRKHQGDAEDIKDNSDQGGRSVRPDYSPLSEISSKLNIRLCVFTRIVAYICLIRHLHISHNPPCLPPSLLFLLGITVVPREIEDNAYAQFWGANKVHWGDLQMANHSIVLKEVGGKDNSTI